MQVIYYIWGRKMLKNLNINLFFSMLISMAVNHNILFSSLDRMVLINIEQLTFQAKYLFDHKEFNESKNICTKIISQHGDKEYSAEAYYILGRIFNSEKDFMKARIIFKKIIDDFPGNIWHDKASEELEAMEAYREIMSKSEKQLSNNSMKEISKEQTYLGFSYFNNRNYEKAVEIFIELLNEYSINDKEKIYLGLAISYLNMERYYLSLYYFKKLNEEYPDNIYEDQIAEMIEFLDR